MLSAAVPTLESVVRLENLTHMVVTHLSPKRIGSLREVLALRAKRQPAARLQLIMSNPALQLLRTSLGMCTWTLHLGAFPLLQINWRQSCSRASVGNTRTLVACNRRPDEYLRSQPARVAMSPPAA